MSFNSTETSSAPGALASALGHIAYSIHLAKPHLPTFLILLASSLFPIIIASHAALSRPNSAAARKRTKDTPRADDDQEDEKTPEAADLATAKDAIILPVMAGCVLATLYFALEYMEDGINKLFKIYFGLGSIFATYLFVSDSFTNVVGFVFPSTYSIGEHAAKVDMKGKKYLTSSNKTISSPLPGLFRHLPIPSIVNSFVWRLRSAITIKYTVTFHVSAFATGRFKATLVNAVALLLALGLAYAQSFTKLPWYLTNCLGTAFSYMILSQVQQTTPSDAATSSLILMAFFFYDIYMVFYTPLMLGVAKKLTEAPIMLKIPRNDGGFGGLGLGDIALPGMAMAFALQFDLYRHYRSLQSKKSGTKDNEDEEPIVKPLYRPVTGGWGERFWTAKAARSDSLKAKSFSKTYFYATVVGYILGMTVCNVVMYMYEHGQPALLYLVPGVLGAMWSTALVRGELRLLWNYSPADEPQTSKKDDKKDDREEVKTVDKPEDTKEFPEMSADKTKDSEEKDKNKDVDSESELSPELRTIAKSNIVYFTIERLTSSEKSTTERTVSDSAEIDRATSPSSKKRAIKIQTESEDADNESSPPANSPTLLASPDRHLRRSSRVNNPSKVQDDGGVDEEKSRAMKRRRKV